MMSLRVPLQAGLLPALAGLAMAGGQAPFGLWGLALFGLCVLIWHVAGIKEARARLWAGWCGGVGYFAGTLFWIVEPFLIEPARDGWMAPFAVIGMTCGMALFWMLAAALSGFGRGARGRALGFALGLGVADLARSYLLTGFPWALIGHIWVDTPVAQAAAYVGPVGLTGLTVMVAGLPMMTLRWPMGTALAVALFSGVWGIGCARLGAPVAERAPAVTVRLVQPNATQRLKWQPGMWDVFVERLLTATGAPAKRPLDLVVWPETSVPYLLADAGDLFSDAVEASGHVPLALGIQRDEGLRYYNSIAAIDGKGRVSHVYDKSHLVPFGEYIPFGDLLGKFGMSAFAAQAGFGYTSGTGEALLNVGRAGKVLPLICYEAIFPQDLRRVEGRADWILQVTNDGWFGTMAGPWQHLAQARMRAIEQGLPLLRAANTGVTAVIDARGRLLQSLPLNRDGWLDAQVPGALATTAYVRLGDVPATVLLLAGLLVLWLKGRPRTG